MQGVLKSLDLFKVAPDTRFQDNKGLHSSKIGQVLTILLISSGISLLVYFSLDMIQKTNPKVQSTNSARLVDILLNNETFPFAFGLMDINNKFYVDERIFTVKAAYTVTNRKVNIVRCDPNTPLFKVSGPEAAGLLWCFSDKQDQVEEIGINKSENLAIDIVSCQNTSTYNSCLPQEEINRLLFGNHLKIFYNDFIFEPNDFDDPIKETVRFFFPSLTTKMIKQTNFFIAETTYITDSGWLFRSIRNDSRVTVDSVTQYFEDREVMGNVVKRIYIRAVTENKTINRSYEKLQDVFSRWNAIFTLLLITAKIICDSYYRFKAQEELVRDIFFLKDMNINKLIKYQELKSVGQTQKDISTTSKNMFIESKPRTEQDKYERDPESPSLQISRKDSSSSLSSEAEDMNDQQKEDNQSNKGSGSPNGFDTNNLPGLNLKRHKKKRKDNNSSPIDSQSSQILHSKVIHLKPLGGDMDDIKLTIEGTPVKNKEEKSDNNFINEEKVKKARESMSGKKDEKSSNPDDPGVSFFNWLVSQVRQTEKYKRFIKRSETVQRKFNFQNHAKRFMGIDLLKYLVLTKDQQIVFDNCIKAYVSLKLQTSFEGDNQHSDLVSEDLKILLNNQGFDDSMQDKALKNLKGRKNPDDRTRKIFELLNILCLSEAELE